MRETKRPKLSEFTFFPITPTPKGLICFISFTFNNQWRINDCALYTRPNGGYRLSYPIRELANKKVIQSVYPISKELGFFVEQILIEEYEQFLQKTINGKN